MKWSVIGLFGRVMNNNVELCSDWLFHSAAQCWALLWLAVSQCGSMLGSALIGCFTVRLISAHFSHSRKETQGGKYIFQYFLSQLYRRVIILYIKCGHQGAAINMWGTETAFKCTITFHFHFRDSRSHVLCLYYGAAVLTRHFTRSDACQWCSGSVNHSPSSSVISPYSVYVVSEILCTAM